MIKISLPDFLIIGAQKSGTTWIYEVLKSHPKIAMAKNRKEVHYFDRYYDRGIEWYKKRFPDKFSGLIGETTPKYIYDKKVPERIKKNIPDVKLICILRNPIKRAYSQYKYLVQEKNYNNSFRQSIDEYIDIKERGLYYNQLFRYLKYFNKTQIKIIIFEEMLENKKEKLEEVANFLNLNYDFDEEKIYGKANVSKIPKFKKTYSFTKSIVKKLYDYDLVFIINFFEKIGFKKIFFSENNHNFPEMNTEMYNFLKQYYREDIEKLEVLLDKDLKKIWNLNY
ncbi:MAG: sulfotransferase domain-containing protein [Bacillota bacterium]